MVPIRFPTFRWKCRAFWDSRVPNALADDSSGMFPTLVTVSDSAPGSRDSPLQNVHLDCIGGIFRLVMVTGDVTFLRCGWPSGTRTTWSCSESTPAGLSEAPRKTRKSVGFSRTLRRRLSHHRRKTLDALACYVDRGSCCSGCWPSDISQHAGLIEVPFPMHRMQPLSLGLHGRRHRPPSTVRVFRATLENTRR